VVQIRKVPTSDCMPHATLAKYLVGLAKRHLLHPIARLTFESTVSAFSIKTDTFARARC
jgi:hypothetical protein